MRFSKVRTKLFLYRVKMRADSVLRQAHHTDMYVNRSMQFGSSRGYWILVAIGLVVMIGAQVLKHEAR